MPDNRDQTSTTPSDQPDAVAPAHDEVPAPVPASGLVDSSAGPGAWTALAAPGKPDGEVDTRP